MTSTRALTRCRPSSHHATLRWWVECTAAVFAKRSAPESGQLVDPSRQRFADYKDPELVQFRAGRNLTMHLFLEAHQSITRDFFAAT